MSRKRRYHSLRLIHALSLKLNHRWQERPVLEESPQPKKCLMRLLLPQVELEHFSLSNVHSAKCEYFVYTYAVVTIFLLWRQ
jgi:hypothetical protein